MSARVFVQIDVTDFTDKQRRRFQHLTDQAFAEVVAEDEAQQSAVDTWTSEALHTALTRLQSEGRSVQAEAIRRAAKNGGSVSRAEVYELAGYSPDRSLRGFTRPVRRICNELRSAGLVPAEAPDLLESDYNDKVSGYQRAGSFSIPAEVIGLID